MLATVNQYEPMIKELLTTIVDHSFKFDPYNPPWITACTRAGAGYQAQYAVYPDPNMTSAAFPKELLQHRDGDFGAPPLRNYEEVKC